MSPKMTSHTSTVTTTNEPTTTMPLSVQPNLPTDATLKAQGKPPPITSSSSAEPSSVLNTASTLLNKHIITSTNDYGTKDQIHVTTTAISRPAYKPSGMTNGPISTPTRSLIVQTTTENTSNRTNHSADAIYFEPADDIDSFHGVTYSIKNRNNSEFFIVSSPLTCNDSKEFEKEFDVKLAWYTSAAQYLKMAAELKLPVEQNASKLNNSYIQ